MRVDVDVPYGDRDGQLLDVYRPATDGEARPAVVLVHGGGWLSGDKAAFAPVGKRLARLGWVAVSINYRLTAPHWPTEVEDVAAAVAWVRDNADTYGIDLDRIGMIGSSAGGNLAALATGYGSGGDVAAVVSWSGPMDLAALAAEPPRGSSDDLCDSPGCAQGDPLDVRLAEYLGCTLADCPDRYREASPLGHVDASTPPMMLANSSDEFIPVSQAQDMADALEQAGVPVDLVVLPGRRHATGYAADVWPSTMEFLQEWLGEVTSTPTWTPTVRPSDHPNGRPRGDGGSDAVWIVVGAIALLVVAGTALVLRRRRR